MNRLEEIKEQTEVSASFRDWFEDEWHRNKGTIDDLILHNKEMSTNIKYLLNEVERLNNALSRATLLLDRYEDELS